MRRLFVASLSLVTISCAALAADAPRPNPRIATGAWATTLKEHPRLIGSKAHLQALAKAKPQEYKVVQSNGSITAVGIVHAVEGAPQEKIAKFIKTAEANVARGPTNVHQDTWIWMTEVVQCFDFFYDKLTPDQRKQMIDWLNANLDSFKADEGAFHNSTLSKIACYLRIAYGTWGENPRAKEFRNYAIEKLYEGSVAQVIREFGVGGGFTECGWYTRGSLWNLVEGLELARRFEKYDGFQQAPKFFYQRLAYELLQPYPGLGEYGNELYAVEGDGSYTYGGHRESPRHTRTLLAQYFRGSELAGYTSATRRKGSNPEARVVDFLFDEGPDDVRDVKTFPLAHCASGIGKVYARSDWSNDATWLRFECGDFWNNHQHFEVGNFEIFRREPLATESGEYADYTTSHSVNWLQRTIAHNCILVYQPGEKWDRLRDGGRNQYGNDGGQTNRWGWVAPNLAEWKKQADKFDRGDLVAYDNQPGYLYVAGDCTKAYAAAKLEKWIRQIVFLRPATIVVFDRVVSTKPDYLKTWLLHAKYEPEIAGQRSSINGQKTQLAIATLLPEGAKIEKVSGYTYDGQTYTERRSGQSDVAPKWRLEVRPAKPAKEDLFLHVLFTDKPQPVELVREQSGVGVKVGDTRLVFTGDIGGKLTTGNKPGALKAGLQLGKFEK